MKIEVKFFASLKEIIGEKQIVIEIAEPVSVLQLTSEICNRYPRIKETSGNIITAVNQEFVSKDRIIHQGEEVAMFPPVSGG